jgi:hypothetical protein
VPANACFFLSLSVDFFACQVRRWVVVFAESGKQKAAGEKLRLRTFAVKINMASFFRVKFFDRV